MPLGQLRESSRREEEGILAHLIIGRRCLSVAVSGRSWEQVAAPSNGLVAQAASNPAGATVRWQGDRMARVNEPR